MRRVLFAIVSLVFLSACEGSSDDPVKDKSSAVLKGTLWDDADGGCEVTRERMQATDYLRKQFEDDPPPGSKGASVAYYKRAASYLVLANQDCFSDAQVLSAQKEFNASQARR